MTVYSVIFNVNTHPSYDDFWSLNHFVGCFSSLEKAKEWIEKDIPKIIAGNEDQYNIYELEGSSNLWVQHVVQKPLPYELRGYYREHHYIYTVKEITIDIPENEEAEWRRGY